MSANDERAIPLTDEERETLVGAAVRGHATSARVLLRYEATVQDLLETLQEVGAAASELGRRLEASEPDRVRELDAALRLAELENQGLQSLAHKWADMTETT